MLQVSGRHKGQYVHAKMLDKYLNELEFGPDNLAMRYVPLRRNGTRIVLDPGIRCGQPRVEPSGYLAEALVSAYRAEGGVEAAAWWYQVDTEEVRIAVDYYRDLTGEPYARAS